MIESIVPVRHKNNFILKKNILLIYFNGLTLSILLLEAYGKKRILKNFISNKFSIENLQEQTLEELLSQKILSNIKNFSYDHCRIILSGNNAIFKFLYLPFSDAEKIKIVAPFELESKLPFSLSECSIDSICIQKEKAELYQIISGLIKQETISKIQEINLSSNLKMDSLSLDVIDTIIHHLENNEIKEAHALIICNETSFIFIFYKDNKIINLKSFEIQEKSAYHAYFEIGEKKDKKEDENSASKDNLINKNNHQEEKVEEKILDEKNNLNDSKREINNNLLETKKTEIDLKSEDSKSLDSISENHSTALTEIKLSLPSENVLDIKPLNENSEKEIPAEKISEEKVFQEKISKIEKSETEDPIIKKKEEKPKIKSLKENIVLSLKVILEQNEIKSPDFKIFLIGENQNSFLFNEISKELSCTIFPYEILKKNEIEISFKDENIKNNFSKKDDILLISSYLYEKAINFNLAHSEENNYKKNLIKKNLILSSILIIFLFGIIISLNIFQIKSLNNQISKAEIESINFLKREFDLASKHTTSLEKAIKESESYVSILENNLPFIASESKYSFIKIFEIISENISKEIKDLKIKEIKWKKRDDGNDSLTVDGSVGNWESLILFEESLKKSELFEEVPQSQEMEFSYYLNIKNKV